MTRWTFAVIHPTDWPSISGSGGNANNFQTKQECEAECQPIDTCGLPIVIEPCRAVIPRYAYNAHSQTCEMFIYGGCGGNANNFDTLEECQASCQPTSEGE